jgi:hypothetical protein
MGARVWSAATATDLAGVGLDRERVEAGHDEALGRGEDADHAEHGEAAVVDLGEQRLLALLRRHLFGQAERVEEVEREVGELGCRMRDTSACEPPLSHGSARIGE